MKANELMIGDWVYDNMLKGYGKIEVLTPFAVQCDIHTDTHHMDFFQPITLTEDILKLNGWTEFYYGHFEDENHRHFRRGADQRLVLSLIKGDKCFCTNLSLGRIDFYYVHQLQRALRLCGLNELADNFKIILN